MNIATVNVHAIVEMEIPNWIVKKLKNRVVEKRENSLSTSCSTLKAQSIYRVVIVLGLSCLLTAWIVKHIGYAINLSQSLPERFFVVHLNKMPKVGDYVLFKAPNNANLPKDTLLIKKILAKEGDNVTRRDQDFFINGKWVAKAKTHGLRNEFLLAGPVGIIGKNQYYVGTQHQDSFDSRYERMGWITSDLILGLAYPLW